MTDENGRVVVRVNAGEYEVRVEKDGRLLGYGTAEFKQEINLVSFGVEVPPPPVAELIPPPPVEELIPPPPPTIFRSPPKPDVDSSISPWIYVVLSFAIAALAAILVLAIRKARTDTGPSAAATPMEPLSTGILSLDPEVDGPLPDLGPEYRIAGLISKGGQGAIYLAESTASGTRFAVKLPTLAEVGGGHQALRAFLREAEESRKLLNAHIITVFKAGIEPRPPRRPYYLMEYFRGTSLRQYVGQFGAISETAALDTVVLRVLDALNYAHRKEPPVVHRDLKPENVLVKSDVSGVILDLKLIDFGLSFSRQGALQGTPPYVAPEVLAGFEPSPASDIFSLGVILVELLKGRPPFYDQQILKMRQRILLDTYDRSGISPPLLPVLDRMLAKDDESRYASAEELIIDMREALFTLTGSVS